MSQEDYSAVPLSKISPEVDLKTDIFLLINDKYIKFKEAGDLITPEKYDLFISKNVKEVFVLSNELTIFEEWVEEIKAETVNKIVAEIGEENRELVEKNEDMKEKVFDVFAEQELTTANVTMLQGMVQNFVEDISQTNMIANVVAKLTSFNTDIAEHSVNVANLATYIAMVSGVNDQKDLENIYTAAIFHDYGKVKIPANVLEDVNGIGYSQAIQDHPVKGAGMVKKIEAVPEIVATMIEQHHENFNGKGYPNNLSGEQIHKFTMLLNIANIYDNQLSLNKNKSTGERHKIAIKFIEYDRGKMFDPNLIPRVIDALKLAFGNYKR